MSRPQHRRGARPRTRAPRGESVVGTRFQVDCGQVGHGGFVVARTDEGRVLFVRHALPGERVIAEITEGTTGDSFWRADAVQILSASPHRVTPPCPYAGPGGCGGCDFQHARSDYQRELKAAVVSEQLRRLAKRDLTVEVEPVGESSLGWRTTMTYVPASGGGHGLRRHRSHEVQEIDQCLIATVDAQPGCPPLTRAVVGERTFDVPDGGFWQSHRDAPQTLVDAVLAAAGLRLGDRVLDLYAGVGLFAAFAAGAVGESGHVIAVEGDPSAAASAKLNLSDLPQARVIAADVAAWLDSSASPQGADVVVLDPPRAGAKRRVVEGVCQREPRAIVHVACDPAALARDVALYAEQGYDLRSLRVFDLFPMTHHVECVALLTTSAVDLR